MTTTTFYVFHGDDTLGIDEAVAKLRQGMGDDINAELNITDLDGTQATAAEALAAASSVPFLADKRLVIVRGMLSWLGRKGAGKAAKEEIARLQEALPDLPDFARLAFVEGRSLPASNKIVKLAQSDPAGYAREYSAPRDTTGWIMNRVRAEYDREIDNRAAVALAAVTGDDLRRADNELIKLVSYVDEDRPISEQDVADLTPYVPEANIFKMVDAVAEGRGAMALELMHRLLMDQKQDIFGLYGMIVRQFRLLLLAREHLDAGGPGDMAQALGVRPFVAQNLTRQARGFTLEQLERIFLHLQETDLKMKTGRIEPALALDLFVASVAG